jgi:hypothetical protein
MEVPECLFPDSISPKWKHIVTLAAAEMATRMSV